MQTNTIEFSQKNFELTIELIIKQLRDKDCQKVEFLRGMLAAYCEIVEIQGWDKKELKINFEVKEVKKDYFK
jgi:hypothetical protein